MTNRVFVIADTHFGHKKVIEFENEFRPFQTIEEHDDELVYRWNNTVNKNDTIWHLGDVLFGRGAFETLKRLKGVKKLVLGNHDHYPIELYLEHFNSVHSSVKLRNALFTHIPIHPNQLLRFRANVHGHMHSKSLNSPNYACVSVEHTDLAPVLIDKVMQRFPE